MATRMKPFSSSSYLNTAGLQSSNERSSHPRAIRVTPEEREVIEWMRAHPGEFKIILDAPVAESESGISESLLDENFEPLADEEDSPITTPPSRTFEDYRRYQYLTDNRRMWTPERERGTVQNSSEHPRGNDDCDSYLESEDGRMTPFEEMNNLEPDITAVLASLAGSGIVQMEEDNGSLSNTAITIIVTILDPQT
ncbi:hypothetical protein D9757_013638 [Collybiopsis confluens]|uniref:Uncharacterized protein n=1 Tax=Collybiopsis confluens TaxID=2823264 RepID=A0A8H5G829_9AGAR|nr:hypothetical protein D9757_013638 [Collybiopsis confluens]